jgi:hypothetical protein
MTRARFFPRRFAHRRDRHRRLQRENDDPHRMHLQGRHRPHLRRRCAAHHDNRHHSNIVQHLPTLRLGIPSLATTGNICAVVLENVKIIHQEPTATQIHSL